MLAAPSLQPALSVPCLLLRPSNLALSVLCLLLRPCSRAGPDRRGRRQDVPHSEEAGAGSERGGAGRVGVGRVVRCTADHSGAAPIQVGRACTAAAAAGGPGLRSCSSGRRRCRPARQLLQPMTPPGSGGSGRAPAACPAVVTRKSQPLLHAVSTSASLPSWPSSPCCKSAIPHRNPAPQLPVIQVARGAAAARPLGADRRQRGQQQGGGPRRGGRAGGARGPPGAPSAAARHQLSHAAGGCQRRAGRERRRGGRSPAGAGSQGGCEGRPLVPACLPCQLGACLLEARAFTALAFPAVWGIGTARSDAYRRLGFPAPSPPPRPLPPTRPACRTCGPTLSPGWSGSTTTKLSTACL